MLKSNKFKHDDDTINKHLFYKYKIGAKNVIIKKIQKE